MVRRVAEADEYAHVFLDLQGHVAFLGDPGLQEACREVRGAIGGFQGIGQIHFRGFVHHACVLESLRQPEMCNGVRANEDFEGVQSIRQRAQLSCDCAGSESAADGLLGVVEHCEGVGSGADGWVEHDHVVVCEGQRLAESGAEELACKPCLGAHDFDWGVVHSSLLPQAGVVGPEELLVEVQPWIALLSDARGVYGADSAF